MKKLEQKGESVKSKIPYILLISFFLLLIQGIYFGEVTKVIEAAVNLCLGCIGIG